MYCHFIYLRYVFLIFEKIRYIFLEKKYLIYTFKFVFYIILTSVLNYLNISNNNLIHNEIIELFIYLIILTDNIKQERLW